MSNSVNPGPSTGLLSAERGSRPLWMLALLAIGFGPFLARLFLNDQLAAMTTQIVNSLHWSEQPSYVHLVRLSVRFLMPTCFVLAVLRFTPLGSWFALTRFSLVCLLVTDTLLVFHLVDQYRLYVPSGLPTFRLSGEITAQIAMIALSLATASLALATAWYRYGSSRQMMSRFGSRWLAEA